MKKMTKAGKVSERRYLRVHVHDRKTQYCQDVSLPNDLDSMQSQSKSQYIILGILTNILIKTLPGAVKTQNNNNNNNKIYIYRSRETKLED